MIIGTALEHDVVSNDFDLIVSLDVTDDQAVKRFFAVHRPTELYHLAGLSRPAAGEIEEFYSVNALGTLHIVSAAISWGCATLVVSSGYIYGDQARPFKETDAIKPVNHYGASKYAGELASLVATRAGGRVVIARPFNHTGPGQSNGFFVGSVVRQAIQIEREGAGGAIKVGNRHTVRDYCDVRDVVRGYQLLLEKGENGSAYNIASGRGVAIDEVLATVVRLARGSITIVDDCDRQRPVDLACLIGDPSRVQSLGWKPEISLEETIEAMLDHDRSLRVGSS